MLEVARGLLMMTGMMTMLASTKMTVRLAMTRRTKARPAMLIMLTTKAAAASAQKQAPVQASVPCRLTANLSKHRSWSS